MKWWGRLWLMLNSSFKFLLVVFLLIKVVMLFSILFRLKLMFFMGNLFVLILEKLRILLIIFSRCWLENWILCKYFCWWGVRLVFKVRWVMLMIVFMGVWILWFILVKKLVLMWLVFFVSFLVCFIFVLVVLMGVIFVN